MTWAKLLRAGLMLAFALAIGEVLYVAIAPNLHVLDDGKCYRCSQPTAGFLAARCKSDGVQTVLNLRGENSDKDWYQAERAAAEKLGVTLIDIGLSSNCPPTTAQFRQVIDVLDHAPRPILIHCHSGSDRTGLVALMYLLLNTDCTVDRAREEIAFRYGHKYWSEAVRLFQIPDAYEDWLRDRGETHTSERFRYWGNNVYRGPDIWKRLGIGVPPWLVE